MGMRWYGEQYKAKVSRDIRRKLDRAGWVWVRHARSKSSDMTNADGKTPSPQGGFPAKATGEHRRKITHEVMPSGVVARVGTNTKHSRYLEQGTKHMEPRPWMFLTNSQMRGTINRILTRKIK